ncbi:site-specific integrase [Sphingobium naphthae]|nr:site-specific integrase [Sphingobium naphthae]
MASVAKRKWTSPDGSKKEAWLVRYVHQGRRRGKTFDLKKDADAFAKKVERELEDGTHVARDNEATVLAISRGYLEHNAMRVRDGRITQARLDNIASAMRNHIVPTFGATVLRDIEVAAVDRFYRDLTMTKGLTPIYARQQVKELNMLEQFAFKRGFTRSRPVQAALADLRGLQPPRIRTLETDDAVAIMRAALKHQFKSNPRVEARTACMVHLAACCGLRLGEILALKVQHVDLVEGVVRVRHSMTNRGTIKCPKTPSSVRDVPMPPHLLAMLADWIERHLKSNPDGLIFTDRDGRQCRHPGVNQNWLRLLRDANLYDENDPIHFHALRHFAGSWWIDNGMPVPDVAKNLGHSDPATTMRIYVHSLSTEESRAAAIAAPAAKLIALVADKACSNRLSLAHR